METKESKAFGIRLPAPVLRRVDTLSEITGGSRNETITRLVESGLKNLLTTPRSDPK